MLNQIFRRIANSMPELHLKLQKAGMHMKPEEFIRQTVLSAFYLTTGAMIFFLGIFARSATPAPVFVIAAVILFLFMYVYMLRLPDVRILKAQRAIDKEVVFVARFIVLEIESGISMYQAMKNITKSYETCGKYFKEIIDRIDLGTTMEDAINETVRISPSWNFRRILWQLLNVIQTGANISKSLNVVTEQIVREQVIEVNNYGKKLNPIAMFYMIVAVILPSLGITMFIVMSSFLGLKLNLTVLMIIAGMLGFTQFMFLAIIKSSRPAVEF